MFRRKTPQEDLIDFSSSTHNNPSPLICGLNESRIQRQPNKIFSFFNLDHLFKVDEEECTNEELWKKASKRGKMKLSSFIKKNMLFVIAGIIIAIIFYMTSGGQRSCNPKDNIMCKLDVKPEYMYQLLLGGMEHRYDYNKKMEYEDYCVEMSNSAHKIISAWSVNGTTKYFKKGDIHEPTETVVSKEFKEESYFIGTIHEWKKSIAKAVGYENKVNINTSVP
jgi:hypothetical protein